MQKVVVCGSFAALLLLGILTFKDYGISWDEPMQLNTGRIAMQYVTGLDDALFSYRDRNYGTAFELVLTALERILGLTSRARALFMMRHFANFLCFFLGVIFFYKLCMHRFRNWLMGLAGAFFLVLSPRIFANSFYNSKDIPFLSVFIISIYTLIRYLDKPTLERAGLHALACAILIDIRIVGVIVPFLTFVFAAYESIAVRKAQALKSLLIDNALVFYAILTTALTILLWPLLWRDPAANFMAAFNEMSYYNFPYTVFYAGRYLGGRELPWHYLPVWILISTPLFYIAFFPIGCFTLFRKRDDLLFMAWFFFPILAIIGLKSVLYDDWRQAYFAYPAFLLISMAGMERAFLFLKNRLGSKNLPFIMTGFVLTAVICLGPVAAFMIKYHPYQNVYFNTLAGKTMADVKKKFELDYWGLSYRKGLEYILANDKGNDIRVCVATKPGLFNALILPRKDACRLIYVEKPEDAEYFLTNYRWHPEDYPYKDERYSIKIGNAKIMSVYKI